MGAFEIQTPTDSGEISFQNVFGAWAIVAPDDVASLLGGFDKPWWVVGGWALDAFTGLCREHGDVDISLFRADVTALRTALKDRLHIWSVGPAGMRPVDERYPEVHEQADQVWLRERWSSPWLVDVLLNPDLDGSWVNRRDRTIAAPLDSVTWLDANGIRYLDPEIVLCFKAKYDRPKDRADLVRTLPFLDLKRREALVSYLRSHHPGHEWLALI